MNCKILNSIIMKKVFVLLSVASMFAFASCSEAAKTPEAEATVIETATEEVVIPAEEVITEEVVTEDGEAVEEVITDEVIAEDGEATEEIMAEEVDAEAAHEGHEH